ncbi:TetR/AcrR family transcriptional regulator, partial [Parabacteroides sp. OttesenSCG-928-G06]|nr:TetR/AcrR family transcriptional regulator [Parabacteroides sp. OttesenSCG-928-G06]
MASKRGHKQEDIIHAGWRLMQRYGVRRVTIEEICREAGVSKMTFYKYFENKMALVKGMIHFYAGENLKEFRQTMAMDISFNEKMERTLYLKLAKSKEISTEFIQD